MHHALLFTLITLIPEPAKPAVTVEAPSAVGFALGTRTGVWTGPYTAPGLGGDLELTILDALGVDLFSDNFAMIGPTLRHDHVIGFSLFAPTLLATSDFFVSPTFGACVDFRFEHADDAPSSSSVLFGVHAGARAKAFVLYDFAFHVSAEGYLYFGNPGERSGWTVRPTDGLGAFPAVVVTAGVAYAL